MKPETEEPEKVMRGLSVLSTQMLAVLVKHPGAVAQHDAREHILNPSLSSPSKLHLSHFASNKSH